MIHSFYILDQAGRSLYTFQNQTGFRTQEGYDSNLVSGFVTALMNFSSEAFSESIQTINLKHNIMVISSRRTPRGILIGVALTDFYDKPYLVQKISQQLLTEFFSIHPNWLDKPTSTDIIQQIDQSYQKILQEKVQKRTITRLIIGVLAAIPVYALASYLYYNPYSSLLSLLAFPAGLLLSAICSYYVGVSETGGISFTLTIGLVNQPMRALINFLSLSGIANFVEFPEIFLIISLALGFIGGILGGWIAERRFLFQADYQEPYRLLYEKLTKKTPQEQPVSL